MTTFTGDSVVRKKPSRFQEWVYDYLKNNTIAGCAYYVSDRLSYKERITWLLIHLILVVLVVCTISEATYDFMDSPTVTTVETTTYPIQNVYFPGVAICNINKISYAAAMEVAEEIVESNLFGNFTVSEVFNMLKYLGHLYLFELDESETYDVMLLHKILLRRYGPYVSNIMERLAPSCRQMMKNCFWGSIERPCEDIFFTRPTGDGSCCIFNHDRPTEDFQSQMSENEVLTTGKVETSRAIGSWNGLTVVVDPQISDYYYKTHPTSGFKVLIFSSFDFPDASSGGLTEVLVSPRTVTSMHLQATSFYSVPQVVDYDIVERECLFGHELARKFQGYYSYSDCIMYCRIDDIRNFCHCVPVFYPYPRHGQTDRLCDLRDLPCLRKFRNRWWRMEPRIDESATQFYYRDLGLMNETDGALNCEQCYPACADVSYKVSVSAVSLTSSKMVIGRTVNKFDDHSIISVYFKEPGTVRLKQDVLFYWYELMSNYGGICGFFLGVSLLSVVELFYFCTLRLYRWKSITLKEEKKSQFIVVKAARPSLQPLYWKEMIQPNIRY